MGVRSSEQCTVPGAERVRAKRLLIVIPTLNEEAHIEGVLDALLSVDAGSARRRVVIVDGGSIDRTLVLARAWLGKRGETAEIIHNPARIQSAAVNLAVRRFGRQADVLIRCDAHARYPPRFCERLLRTLEQHQADAVVIPMDSVGEQAVQRAIAWISNSFIGTGGSAHRAGRRSGFVDHGHHAAFRLDSFLRAGGYDETFTHNEDAELDCRQRALGSRIYLDASIRVVYAPRSSLLTLWCQYLRYGQGRSRTLRRYPSSARMRQVVVPFHVLLCVLGVSARAGWPWLAAYPAAYAAVLVCTSLFFALRHRALAGLLTGPAAGIMHCAWGCGFLFGLIRHRERPGAHNMISRLPFA